MAYASWAIPNKASGSGNDTVQWTGSPNTGRNSRQTTAIFRANGVQDQTLTINQLGKTEFVSMLNSMSVSKSGGSITITGTSNSSKLTFSKGTDNIGITIPAKYTAGGVQTSNGVAIAGDPGATAQFEFSIKLDGIGENETISEKTAQLIVTDNAVNTATCLITQAAGDPELTISPTTIELSAAGTPAIDVTVSSNTTWTII